MFGHQRQDEIELLDTKNKCLKVNIKFLLNYNFNLFNCSILLNSDMDMDLIFKNSNEMPNKGSTMAIGDAGTDSYKTIG